MTISQVIMNELLNRLERRQEGSFRRVIIKADWFEMYDYSNMTKMKAFHQSVKELKDFGYIDYQWVKYEKDNLLDKVILVEEKLDEVYEWLGRKPLEVKQKVWLQELHLLRKDLKTNWLIDYTDRAIKTVEDQCKLLSKIPESYSERMDFYKLLKHIDRGQVMHHRYMSARLFGDSKVFEKLYRSKIISITRDCLDLQWENDQVLEHIGILSTPEEILVCGSMVYWINGNELDTKYHIYGTSLNSETVAVAEISGISASRILTIENKATYYEYIKIASEDELVIYLGGFFGKTTRVFLEKLSAFIDINSLDINFFHWGDIDLGGLLIFEYLCQVIKRQVMPYNMDRVTYLKYYADDSNLSQNQLNKIGQIRSHQYLYPLVDTIDTVLIKRKRLEQERISLLDNSKEKLL